MSGLIDKPIEKLDDDCFEVGNYIYALAKFIEECDTPMTIAVQGDWGSGKTSIMSMVRNELKKEIHSIWFNTWQFSKFNMDDKLTYSLLFALADELSQFAPLSGRVKKLKGFVSAFAWKILSYSADAVGASKIADDTSKMAEMYSKMKEETPFDSVLTLKQHFQESINEITRDDSKIVIFIDDLDRLEPSRALDVLEVLNLFLDCENCVYVLAIDYNVVVRGVKEKYGDEQLGKEFFDKIIQLPFYMPVAHYNIQKYVTRTMGDKLDKNIIEKYVKLIRCSVGCNPRKMKRLFNAFELVSMIRGNNGNEQQKMLLFSLLCLQLAYEDTYNFLVENIEMLGAEQYSYFIDGDIDRIDQTFNLESETDEKKIEIRDFMTQLIKIIAGRKKKVSDEDMRIFRQVLQNTTATNGCSVISKSSQGELSENKIGKKTIRNTDVKYKICCLGSGFHLGYGKKITVEFEGKTYGVKMHDISAGRIDGLSKFYYENKIKEGDQFEVIYRHHERKVIFLRLLED